MTLFTTDKADRVTVAAIIEMTRGLQKTTIAECIEDQPTLDLITQLGADYAQGYHLGRPGPLADTLGDYDHRHDRHKEGHV